MAMQDNEFDELFHSKLDEFEIEPSAKVWPGIAGELHSAKHKKTLQPWLSIAASIAVAAGLGVLFIRPKPVKNIKPEQPAIATAIKPVTAGRVPNIVAPGFKLVSITPHKVKEISKVPAVNPPVRNPVANIHTAGHVVIAAVPVIDAAPEVIATAPQKQTVNIGVVPDKATALTPTLPDQNMPDITAKPVLLASQPPVASKKDSVQVKPRHKIHGLAGLVNLVIAKVDKRKDDVQTDDDNESNIVGVNLGLVKIKKGE
jgi:hypothetical protein